MGQEWSKRFWSGVDKQGPDECWLWSEGCFDSGYGQVRQGKKKRRAHRVAWELARGPIPGGLCVLHSCDNPPCCNPSHLFIGTLQDNSRDRDAKGRGADVNGERNPAAKLNREDVANIRRRSESGEAHRSIAALFGIHRNHVGRIVRKERWANG